MQHLDFNNEQILLKNRIENRKLAYYFFKQIIDVVCSVVALKVLSLIILIVSILIRLESKGNPIFSQERVGENRKNQNVQIHIYGT